MSHAKGDLVLSKVSNMDEHYVNIIITMPLSLGVPLPSPLYNGVQYL